ncbi:MAG: hypothetical protein H7X70_03370 [Candidatus Kapabacteria bacterium]|nr:hypothetical protein [Candidatus Kapabacteria bacterium]
MNNRIPCRITTSIDHFTEVVGTTTAVSVVGATAVDFTSLAFIEQHDEEALAFFAFTAVVEHDVLSAVVHSLSETFLAAVEVVLQQEVDFTFLAEAFSSQFTPPAIETAKEATATIAVIEIIRIFMLDSKFLW